MNAITVGVKITSGQLAGATNDVPDSGRLVVAAPLAKGPDAPQVVRSISHYANIYGGRTMATAAVFDTLELFFGEGGGEAVIARVFGPGSSVDTVTLKDTTDLEPLDVLKIDSKRLGSGSGLSVTVGAGNFTVFVDGIRRETYDATSISTLIELLGDSEHVNASYVGVAPISDAITLAPGEFDLSGGTDDALNVSTADYLEPIKAALAASPGAAVAVPGHNPGPAGLATIADAIGRHLLIAGTRRGASSTEDGWAAGDAPGTFRENIVGAWPWVRVPDSDRTKLVPSEGYLGACRARAHNDVGPWGVGAGDRSRARFAIGVAEVAPLPSDFELESRLNPINIDRGRITLGDYRSATSTPENPVMASESDVMASIEARLGDALAPYVFQTVDSRGFLFSEMYSACESVLQPIADGGGLYARSVGGEEVDPGFRVTIDASNNTPETLSKNVVNVTVSVRLSPTARLIDLQILRVPVNGAL